MFVVSLISPSRFWSGLTLGVTLSAIVSAEPAPPANSPWSPLGPLGQSNLPTCASGIGIGIHSLSTSASPWVHPIRCKTLPGSDPESHPYCLFISPTFHNNLGLGIVTTPAIASRLESEVPLASIHTPWNVLDLSTTPGPVSTADGPAYEVSELPGKGKGVIALRNIRQREVFMLDYAALLFAREYVESSAEERQRGMTLALDGLPATTQRAVWELVGSRATNGKGEAIEDVVRTNACSVLLGDEVAHMGVFPEVSRMNHACNPNAFYRFSQTRLRMEVVALRDIAPGEEININYAFLGMPHEIRRQFLRDHWHFNCTCARCQLPADEVEASDARRMRIVKIHPELRQALGNGDTEKAFSLVEEMLSLLEAEDLTPLAPEFYGILGNLYVQTGDVKTAKILAETALEKTLDFYDEDSHKVSMARGFLRALAGSGQQ